jgi:glycerol-3-phosphate dehydrogenase (NAD(P)+)
MSPEKIAVLGGGSWGATLGSQLAENGHDVSIWEFDRKVAEKLQADRKLTTLPQLNVPDSVKVSNDMAEVLKGRKIILSVVPSHTVRSTFQKAVTVGTLEAGAMVITATKGLEDGTFATMSQIIRETFANVGDIVILSGPSHAEEVAQKRPVALVAASVSEKAAEKIRDLFTSESFRVYTSDDPKGVELGGSLKNIYAVACGVVDGLDLGDNTKAALLTRSLAEMTRLGNAMGARTVTFFGLSGLGDLIVTCNSKHSRNRLLGEKVGQGKTLEQALKEMTMVAEGVVTCRAAYKLAQDRSVNMPIVNEMYQILFAGKPAKESIKDLMTRQVRGEMEGIAV